MGITSVFTRAPTHTQSYAQTSRRLRYLLRYLRCLRCLVFFVDGVLVGVAGDSQQGVAFSQVH